MTETSGKVETLRLIREAIYELQIGPAEISSSPREPKFINVKFENQKGNDEEIFVPIPSNFATIYDALSHAYHGTGK